MAAGPTVTFSGTVKNATTGAPVPGARVTINGVSSVTDGTGTYVVTLHAATKFHVAIIAAGFLSTSLDISGSGLITGAQHFDFAGAYGLKPLGGLTAVFSGVITDAQTGMPVAHAAVTAPGSQAIADARGHYQFTVPSAARIQMLVTALGYQWRPPVVISQPDHTLIQGRVGLSFSGASGLVSAFRTSQGDVLNRFSQVMPATPRVFPFTGSTTQGLEPEFAATLPNGDAHTWPIGIRGSRYSGSLTMKGRGIYQLEINASNGFAIFDVPIYHGVAYHPPLPPPLYPPDDPRVSPTQLEQEALGVLNRMRVKLHRAPFTMLRALQQEARLHSVDIVTHGYFDVHPHIGSDGSSPEQRITGAHVPFVEVGEDVAIDASVRSAIDGLLQSPGHRANILLPVFTKVGIGVARQADAELIVTIDFVH